MSFAAEEMLQRDDSKNMLVIYRIQKGIWRLEARTVVRRGLEETFDFFSEVGNLNMITPPWLEFRILESPPAGIEEGAVIKYRLKLHRIPINWTSEIRDWNPPYRFRDVQVSGPFQRWSHLHTFSELDDRSTMVTDMVDYSVPGGGLINWLFVARDLRRIFSYRRERLVELLS